MFYHILSVKSRQEGTQKAPTSFVWSETEPEIPVPTHKIEEIRMDTFKSQLLKFSFNARIKQNHQYHKHWMERAQESLA